jgi:hypothetical protein
VPPDYFDRLLRALRGRPNRHLASPRRQESPSTVPDSIGVSHLAEPVPSATTTTSWVSNCDDEELKVWLRLYDRTATGQVTRTYVVVDEDNDVVGVGVRRLSSSSFAVNEACDVPNKSRPAFVPRLVRSLAFLVMLAAFVLVSQALTVLGPLVGGSNVAGAGGLVVAVVLNVGLFAAMFKVLGPASFGWRDHFAGAVLAGVGWEGLQFLGQYLVRHDVRNMTPVCGQFAVVLGLISFLSLASQLIVYAMALNTVRKSGLWPRSIGSRR